MLIRNPRFKKAYETGGNLPYGQIGATLGEAYDTLTPTNQYGVKSNLNSFGSGALKGAGTGAAIGSVIPGIGTAIGAGLGGIAGGTIGLIRNNKLRDDSNALIEKTRINSINQGNSLLRTYDRTGSNSNGIYAKYGGNIPTMKLNGGNLTSLSSDSVAINGNKHSQGGVKLNPQLEVEGGETINNDFVFSDELGFADRHKKLTRQIAKVEKRPNNQISLNTFNLLKQKEEALKIEQETTKQILGINDNTFKYGGNLKMKRLC